jgi:hypothetical protein
MTQTIVPIYYLCLEVNIRDNFDMLGWATLPIPYSLTSPLIDRRLSPKSDKICLLSEGAVAVLSLGWGNSCLLF